ncbi:MAG: hypothetical protein WA584_22330 [Pyrinomonadaceae bacterium]
MENKHGSTNLSLHQVCTGASCDFAVGGSNGQVSCLSGSGTCLAGDLLEAESSGIHDDTLIEATQKIKQILSEIPADSDGRKLSFLVTNMGLLLAWVNHDEDIPANAVTAKDDNEILAKALKLKNWETIGNQS